MGVIKYNKDKIKKTKIHSIVKHFLKSKSCDLTFLIGHKNFICARILFKYYMLIDKSLDSDYK